MLTIIDRLVADAAGSREEALADAGRGRPARRPAQGARGPLRRLPLPARRWRWRRPNCAPTNPEARDLWAQVMEGWVADVTAVIEVERARGAAPPGQPARELAIALVQMNERVQYATFAGESPSLEDERVLDVLVDIWLRAIYGTAEPGCRVPRPRCVRTVFTDSRHPVAPGRSPAPSARPRRGRGAAGAVP